MIEEKSKNRNEHRLTLLQTIFQVRFMLIITKWYKQNKL